MSLNFSPRRWGWAWSGFLPTWLWSEMHAGHDETNKDKPPPYNPQSSCPWLRVTTGQPPCQSQTSPSMASCWPSQQLRGSVISPILQMRKPRAREVKPLGQSHTASTAGLHSPSVLTPKPVGFCFQRKRLCFLRVELLGPTLNDSSLQAPEGPSQGVQGQAQPWINSASFHRGETPCPHLSGEKQPELVIFLTPLSRLPGDLD